MLIIFIGSKDQGSVSVSESSNWAFSGMTCSAVLLYYTLFAMSRVSYLLVRDSFNLAFLVTFAFYFLVVKVTKSFGIKRNFFYWPYIIVNVPTMYLLRTTNNIPSTYGIQKKKLHLLLYDLKKPRIFQKLLNLPKKVVTSVPTTLE